MFLLGLSSVPNWQGRIQEFFVRGRGQGRRAAQNFLQNGTDIVRRRQIFPISTVYWANFAPRNLSGLQNQPIKAPQAKIVWNLVQTFD